MENAKREALERSLESALTFSDEGNRALVLAGLAPQLDGELLERGLETVRTISDREAGLMALASFLPVAPNQATLLVSIREAMATYLWGLQMEERKRVLNFCALEKLLAPPILSLDITGAVAGHIMEVCRGWRWM